MNPAMSELPLRDIHLPESIAWWPLAPGWWLLIVFMLISPFLLIGLRRIWLRHKHAPIRLAYIRLEKIQKAFAAHQDKQALINDCSILLRQTVIALNKPGNTVAGLQGDAWLAYLDQGLLDKPFSTGVGRCLLHGPYSNEPNEYEPSAVFVLIDVWLKQQRKLT